MKLHKLFLSAAIAVSSLLCACTGATPRHDSDSSGDTIKLKYAEHINIVKHDGYTTVTLDNPWKPGTTLHTYILVARADSASQHNLPEGTIVYTPVNRAVVATSPHCRLLLTLGAGASVKGMCDMQYITSPQLKQLAKNNAVADCGSSMNLSIEKIAACQPQAILVSPFEGSSYSQLENMGTPVIECADYMETSALGRAEWMRFYGMLVGKEAAADSIFAMVDSAYNSIASTAKRLKHQPKVMTERVTSGVWYCPGGKSSMARLIADAGGRYAFDDDKHSGSLNLSPEKAIERAAAADFWLFVYYGATPLTRAQLLTEYKGYGLMKAFKDGNIYECNGKLTPYFEEISFRPDLLLAELAAIFHPDTFNAHKRLYYFKENEQK